jgi:hypothetical protein
MANEYYTNFNVDDVRLMYSLGVSHALLRFLLQKQGLPEPDYLSGENPTATPALSRAEIEILRAGGAIWLDEDIPDGPSDICTMAGEILHECRLLVDHSYDQFTVAKILRISPEEAVTRSQAERADLYAFQPGDGRWRFPHWQFDGASTIPHLQSLLAAARKTVPVNPLVLYRFFLSKTSDLEHGTEYLSPRSWLVGELDPGPVLQLAQDL